MGNEIIFKDLITLFRNPDRIRIVKEGRDLYVGFLGMMEEEDRERFAGEVVERVTGSPELKHRKWKEWGLMSPLLPDQVADFSFSDLQLTMYNVIVLKA